MQSANAGKTLKRITFDFETRSECDLKKSGAYKYSLDRTTRPTCLAYKCSDGDEVFLLTFHEINRPWEDVDYYHKVRWELAIKHCLFSAHNAFFERCIYENILVKRYGWPHIPFDRYRCTAAKAAACALPRSLDGAGAALNLTTQKDRMGYVAMMQTCKPTKEYLKGKTKHKFLEPHTHPEIFRTLYHYCKQDVLTEELLDQTLPDLNSFEQKVWHLNQEINWRGLEVDIPTIQKIVDIMAIESKSTLEELDDLTMGLVTKPGARKSILDFLALEGIKLPDIRAKTVDDVLKGGKLSPEMRRLLEIRKALSKTSTKKYQACLDRAGGDGRVHDLLLYHGASTGRDTGTGVQPHNWPRPIIHIDSTRPYRAVENVIKYDAEFLKLIYGENLSILFSSILRNMIIPSDDHELFVADFSKIEVAVLWWLAGNKRGLKVLHEGKDPYIYQAAANRNIRFEDVTDQDRQLGKAQILGCFTENILILTPRGWTPILKLDINDKVWDGVEWVNHSGIHYQGKKDIIHCWGIGVTPEHLILTPENWVPAHRVHQEEKKFLQSTINLARLGLKVSKSAQEAALKLSLSSVDATQKKSIQSIFMRYKRDVQLDVIFAPSNNRENRIKNIGGIQKSYLTTHIARDFLIGLVQRLRDVKTQKTAIFTTTVGEEFMFSPLGGLIENYFLNILLVLTTGTNQILNWIELMSIKGMSRVIFNLLHDMKMSSIVEKFQNFNLKSIDLKKKMPVYDIINAGPRHRFTILTIKGPMIVSNCGYGMGWSKFQKTAYDMHRLKLSDQQAKDAVKNYRETNPTVPKLWKDYETAAIMAIEDGVRVKVGKCKFYCKDKFLWVELPSGRSLAYREPRIGWRESEFGEQKTIEFWAVNSLTKKWSRERTWGGTLTANIDSGIARDLMKFGEMAVEKAGYKVLLTVHDEILSEREKGKGTITEFNRLMCSRPEWIDEHLPLDAKGEVVPRYLKL